MIRFVFGFLPAFITLTDDLPEDVAGVANGVRVRIRPAYANDEGLIQHELDHVKEYYLRVFTLGLRKRSHLEREVSAYKVQLGYYYDTAEKHDWRVSLFAGFLTSERYGFGISYEQALALLTQP